jgi:hypothetical protein
MRALFWIFPAILKVGEKGEMIKAVKYQLGGIASKMWKDTKLACETDTETRSLLSIMRMLSFYPVTSLFWQSSVKTVDSSPMTLDEEAVISQLRTIISAGYETVSAIIAVSTMEFCSSPSLTDFSGYSTNSPFTQRSKIISEMKYMLYPTHPSMISPII